MLLTIFAYGMGKFGFSGIFVMFLLLLSAFIKSHFVMADFMELRDVSLIWRVIMFGWLWVVCVGIGISFLFSI
ncbi:MAG: hypothetical protein GY781_17505 [Gammaproteobacteria bacterium]|nr:hypothetical protein [Gammaproteobacteria bacterium]